MPRKYANRAIIVLESPWELDAADANRSSKPMSLGESLQFVIQPEGQGHSARNVSADVFAMHAAFQLDDGDDEDEGDEE